MSRIRLTFRGKEWVIPEAKAFEAGERLEEIVTLGELGSWGNAPRFHKLARGFAELLRFAGCRVTNDEVFTEMMAEVRALMTQAMAQGLDMDQAAARQMTAGAAIAALTAVLLDGAPEMPEAAPPGKPRASSGRRSRSR